MPTSHVLAVVSAAEPCGHSTTPCGNSLMQATLWLMGFAPAAGTSAMPALCRFVRHHGVGGLLRVDRVKTLAAADAAAVLAERRHIALRGLVLGGTLKRVLAGLTARGLQPLALKGPALAVQAHGDLGARGGVDLDLYLDTAHWPEALDVLQGLGYRRAPEQPWPLPAATHELVLTHPQQPRIELHRRLLRHQHLLRTPAPITEVVDLQGTEVTCLAPAYALPYLIAHANQHCFRRLIWLVDIYALLQQADLDVQQLAAEIQRTGTCAMLDTCLSLLTQLFGLQVPAPLQQVRRPCRASRQMVDVALQAIRESLSDDQVAMRQGLFARVRTDIALQDTLPARWQALRDWLSPTAKDSQWLALPRPLAFLYPLVRVSRLLLRRREH